MESMDRSVRWVGNGGFLPPSDAPFADEDDRALIHRRGLVQVVLGREGVTLRWSLFAAGWSSLYAISEWVLGLRGPFQLQYYAAGWFNERYDDRWIVSRRIEHLIHKSDVHLSQRIYIHQAPEAGPDAPSILRRALREKAADEACSIDCLYDEDLRCFRVVRVGAQSTIAKLWGLNPVSYPCLSGHSYDLAVSRAYPLVAQSGEPHYDHIYAAMASSRGDVVWVPYQRVVLPFGAGGKRGVRVVTELAKVDISPL